jgi:transposase
VKTNRRDARKLAELGRAGLLTVVQPPTPDDEAVRDLARARDDAREDLQRCRHRLGKLLLRRGLHVERWFALLSEKQIKRGAHRSTPALEAAIRAHLDLTNESPKPFVWTKTVDQIFASIARYCQRISDSPH